MWFALIMPGGHHSDLHLNKELQIAVSANKLSEVRNLLVKGADPNARSGPFTVTDRVGEHPELLRLLLVAGADVNYLSNRARPYPLCTYVDNAIYHKKASQAELRCIRLFVLAGGHCRGTLQIQDPQGPGPKDTLISLATDNGDVSLLKLLKELGQT